MGNTTTRASTVIIIIIVQLIVMLFETVVAMIEAYVFSVLIRFMVYLEFLVPSILYKIRSEGRAIKIRIIAGIINCSNNFNHSIFYY